MSPTTRNFFLALFTAFMVWLAVPPPPVELEISRETTFVNGPQREDGSIDYAAALDKIAREGVTPENNALVPILQATGPDAFGFESPGDGYYEALGMSPPHRDGDYLVDLDAYIEKVATPEQLKSPPPALTEEAREQIKQIYGDKEPPADELTLFMTTPPSPAEERSTAEYERATTGPWNAEDAPWIKGWLDENAKPLRLIEEAARRPRFYAPKSWPGSEREPGALINTVYPSWSSLRRAARMLSARALLRFGAGDVDAAWADVLAIHRLARHTATDTTFIARLVAVSLEDFAHDSLIAVAASGKLSAEQARRLAAERAKLPDFPPMKDMLFTERLIALDVVFLVRRQAGENLGVHALPAAWNEQLFDRIFDINLSLRRWNEAYDQADAMLAEPTWAAQRAALKKRIKPLLEQVNESSQRAGSPAFWLGLAAIPPTARRQRLTELVTDMTMRIMLPSFDLAVRTVWRQRAVSEMADVCLTLAAYHADHRAYPDSLNALTPKYLKRLPQDLFIDKPLNYKRTDDGYMLYSVGPNETDDGGDPTDQADIVIRVAKGRGAVAR